MINNKQLGGTAAVAAVCLVFLFSCPATYAHDHPHEKQHSSKKVPQPKANSYPAGLGSVLPVDGSSSVVADGSVRASVGDDGATAAGLDQQFAQFLDLPPVDVDSILKQDPLPTKEDPKEWIAEADPDPTALLPGRHPKKPPANDYPTKFKGSWELVKQNAGVSAMHLQVLPNNKAVMFDSTVLGPSQLPLPKGHCRFHNNFEDCWAHAGEYDIETGAVRPLRVMTDTWCSSGGVNTKGQLVQAGGWLDGGKAVRYLELCDTCDFREFPTTLSGQRWYATQQVLPDGSFVVVGGRNMLNYEFIPAEGKNNPTNFNLPFLQETTDNIPGSENNLYPHVHLSTDGNLFVFANYKAILLDPKKNKVLRRYPDLPGGARCYPGSAASAVLPIKLGVIKPEQIPVEVAICGGAPKESYRIAETKKQFIPALKSCGRIKVNDPNAKWKIEQMPNPRVMADMLILPTGDLLMINGAKLGCSGWEFADDPYFNPVIYRVSKPKEQRFEELAPTTIARMYHSTSAVLPDGKILVAGSSTHNGYQYVNVKFPTELRVEKFSPPYLDPALATKRPVILPNTNLQKMKYGQQFNLGITVNTGGEKVDDKDLKVTMYSPAFTTHGYSMNQRLIVLGKSSVLAKPPNGFQIALTAPPNGGVAPPGYYMLFAVHRGLPSKSIWVLLDK